MTRKCCSRAACGRCWRLSCLLPAYTSVATCDRGHRQLLRSRRQVWADEAVARAWMRWLRCIAGNVGIARAMAAQNRARRVFSGDTRPAAGWPTPMPIAKSRQRGCSTNLRWRRVATPPSRVSWMWTALKSICRWWKSRFRMTYQINTDGTHPHVHGANLGMRADAYLAAGGWNPLPTAEDHDLVGTAARLHRSTPFRRAPAGADQRPSSGPRAAGLCRSAGESITRPPPQTQPHDDAKPCSARFADVCRDELPGPGSGNTAERHRRIFAAGREDLSLAKLAEAHWDAVAILREAGHEPAAGARYAVWASEVPGP